MFFPTRSSEYWYKSPTTVAVIISPWIQYLLSIIQCISSDYFAVNLQRHLTLWAQNQNKMTGDTLLIALCDRSWIARTKENINVGWLFSPAESNFLFAYLFLQTM